MFYTSKLDLHLYFNNGILTDYQSADGLRTAARFWKQYSSYFLGCYEIEAQTYWGDDVGKILNEINIQSDAWSQTPNASKNEFVPQHYAGNDTVNYKMLMVYHYDQPITLNEFLEVNHGRYKTIGANENPNTKRMSAGNYYYDFDPSGKLVGKGKLV